MEREWTDQQIRDTQAQLAEAKRQGMWISAPQAQMFSQLLRWWARVSTTGWKRPIEGNMLTVGQIRAQGVTHLYVSCLKCSGRADRKIAFDDLHLPSRKPLPDHAVFLDLPNQCRFRCVKCGSREVRVMPSWPSGPGMEGSYGQNRSIPLIEPRPVWRDEE